MPPKITMAISQGTSMARNVFDHRKNAAIQMAGDGDAAQGNHGRWFGGIGTVADDVMRAGDRDIEHRRAIGIDAHFAQLMCHQPCAKIGCLPPLFGIALEQFAEPPGRGPGPPMRRPKPLNLSAFLIDEDRRLRITHSAAQFGTKRPHLIG